MSFGSSIALGVLALTVVIPACAQVSDRQFLLQAISRVDQYVETFHDLTAEETMTIRLTNHRGEPVSKRTIVSSLIIYRSQADAKRSVEYRDVVSVDGKVVKDHTKRAIKLLERMNDSKTAVDELERITKEGSRYNRDVTTVNMTLNQALPLEGDCRSAFKFSFLGLEEIRGMATRVYSYDQVRACGDVRYQLGLPRDYEIGPKTHTGKLWLEASTARLVREVRDVFTSSVAHPASKIKVIHEEYDFQPSSFDILVPFKIDVTSYRLSGMAGADGPIMLPRVYLTQMYGPFSRFEVSVEQTVNEPKQK